MIEQRHVAVGVACFGVVAIAVTLFLWRWFCHRPANPTATSQLVTRTDSMNERLQSGIAKLHQEALFSGRREFGRRGVGGYYMIRRGVSGKPLFSWSDQPELITDAVEHGWSRFAFAPSFSNLTSPSPTASARLLGMCAAGDLRRESEPEMSWEVCQDSADLMQKVRLNAGASNSGISVIRTALPLPGPALGKNSSFPQEAYFEITVHYCLAGEQRESISGGNRKAKEGERTKLIPDQSSDGTSNRGSSVRVIDDSKLAGRDDGVAALCVGLTAGGSLPLKLPGSYPGSVGFNTDGSVYLDGVKLVFGSEKTEWGRTEKVIGVGFEPKQKRVFFTVDSEVIHVVNSKTEEFGTPLYPTLAANSDVSVVVNLGQSPFKYGPANLHRTSNPCFMVNSPAATIGYEDSKELFSMGRIDSQWLNRCGPARGSQVSPGNPNRALDFDEDSEADLFEIVLDSCGGRSPKPGV